MKNLLLLLLSGVLLFSACGKIELPEEDTFTDVSDDIEVVADTISVAEFIDEAEDGTAYWVSGYVVGFIDGTSVSQAVFGVPTEDVNTNMLLADSPDETAVARCIAVKLAANSVFRKELNLYDHPEAYLQHITLVGLRMKYFNQPGITTIYNYHWTTFETHTPTLDSNWQYVEEGRAQKKNTENSYR